MKNYLLPLALSLLALGCQKKEEDTGGDTVFTTPEGDADTDSDTDSDTDTDTDTDTTDTDTTDTDTTDTDTDLPADPFVFLSDDPSTYTRVDRMGMPAVATAVITDKDAYNQANPVDDAAGTFVGEITANVAFLHSALDDDLVGVGATPCAAAACVAQAAPLVVPDSIGIDTAGLAGFPNGRLLTDPVIDVTLALILLDLTAGHTVLDLVGTNPTANDVAFLATFPYLAPAH